MSRINDPSLTWKDGDIPFSADFDDIYYKEDGLDETNEVFLIGNNLPQAWIGQKQFTIAETGFGTGLNFLATWKLFEETAKGNERLDFISVEQSPLSVEDLQKCVKRLENVIGAARIKRFIDIYPLRIPGFHRRHVTDRITLTLIFDDALRAFKELDCQVDAWFLDGFSPSKNESLWHVDLFHEMARLSHSKTTLSTFTAASAVRQGLTSAGFDIQRIPGHGHKKHRIIGGFSSGPQKKENSPPSLVHIIGAGLAGAGAAYALKRRGINIEVFEKESSLGQGASGNRLGLINPKIEAQDNPRNDAGLSAFSFATHLLKDLSDIGYRATGALHLAVDSEKEERLKKFMHMSWLKPHMRWIDAARTQEICGQQLIYDGLYYSDAASVEPQKLVKCLLKNIPVHFNENCSPEKTTLTVLCSGLDLKSFDLPLQPVKGQVTYISAPAQLKCPVMFGSYATPLGDEWALGATFEQNKDDPVLDNAAREKNIAAVRKIFNLPAPQITSEWAQIRTASRDRFPIVGKIDKNLYISGALGSHGIQFGLLLGEILACELTGAPMPIGRSALEVLSVARFQRKK